MMNLLGLAMTVIPPEPFKYFKFKSRDLNDIGVYEASYCNPVDMMGSVQPVPRSLYQQNGLDFQKNYFIFFFHKNVFDIERDVSGDQTLYKGMRFQCLSKVDWFFYDGWIEVLCVEVPKDA